MKSHVSQHGLECVSDRQLSIIIDLSKRPIDSIQPSECPFCDKPWAKLDSNPVPSDTVLVVDPDQFRRHLGHHLQQVALFALPRFVQDQDYPRGSSHAGGIPDLDAMSQGYRWVRDDCGRGWNIVSGKRATFTAIGYFLNLYRIMKAHQSYEPSLLRTLQRHSKSEQVAFSPDSRLLASGSQHATIDIWELATGALLRTLSGHSRNVLSIHFHPIIIS